MPVIGLSTGHPRAGTRRLDGADVEYSRAVQLAAGDPVLLPSTSGSDISAVVARIDGLLLTGGGDVDPSRYGAPRSPETAGVDAERDEVEFALLVAALGRGLPVLGVCRGAQVINVALGGTLHQHLPAVSGLDHRSGSGDDLAHIVSVAPGTALHDLVGGDDLEVNSRHHQAVGRLAGSLRTSALSPDGIVEAFELEGGDLIAVQWHPENLVAAPAHLALFQWLTSRARVSPLCP